MLRADPSGAWAGSVWGLKFDAGGCDCLLLGSCVCCGAVVWSEHPTLSGEVSAHVHPWARSSWPFPAPALTIRPSLGIPKHRGTLHEPMAALLRRRARSPRSPGCCQHRGLAAGSDTILPLSKHPWRAVIRLFWLLISVAVPRITRPAWPLPAAGCSVPAAVSRGGAGLWRCHRGGRAGCAGTRSPCSQGGSLWVTPQICLLWAPASGLFHRTSLLRIQGTDAVRRAGGFFLKNRQKMDHEVAADLFLRSFKKLVRPRSGELVASVLVAVSGRAVTSPARGLGPHLGWWGCGEGTGSATVGSRAGRPSRRAPALPGTPLSLSGGLRGMRSLSLLFPAVPCRGGRKGQESRFLLSN